MGDRKIIAGGGLCVFCQQKGKIMQTFYWCDICDRKTTVKRHFGVGTIILWFITFGLGLLAIPFYRKKCVFCKGTRYHKMSPQELNELDQKKRSASASVNN